MFYTPFTNRPKRTPSNPGDEFLEVFQEEVQKDGSIGIVCTGKKNIFDMIQVDLESTKIENIIKACALGDFSRLREQEPVYIDATTFPKTLMEVQNIMVKAKEQFETMPAEVRELFNNNPDIYVSELGTKEFLEKMAPYNKQLADIKEAGSLKEYNKKVADQAKFEKDVAAMKEVSNES